MGFNTVAVLYNDQSDRWPEEIRHAMQSWTRHELRNDRFDRSGHFGWGWVISTAHADDDQVTIVGQNHGRLLTPFSPVENQSDLSVLAELLRCHGYSVKSPGDKRAKPPHKYGYGALK
jgi:hypothetical protein